MHTDQIKDATTKNTVHSYDECDDLLFAGELEWLTVRPKPNHIVKRL